MTELEIEPYHIQGVRLGTENPLPMFRHPDPDNRNITFDPSLPSGKKELASWRTLPCRMPDRYTRNKGPSAFKSAVLEKRYSPGGVKPGETIYFNVTRANPNKEPLAWIPTFSGGRAVKVR